MTTPEAIRDTALRRLSRPLRLTRLGMAAERFTLCFWKAWSVLFVALAALMMGFHESAPLEAVWIGGLAISAAFLWFLFTGLRWFRWPTREDALQRLDQTLPGQPLQALGDAQAIGTGDAASEAVWAAHLERMAARAAAAKRVKPDLRISRRDPYALRYVALTALAVALLFGSLWRVSTLTQMAAPGGPQTLAEGPAWEGWIEPPTYTGMPALYLNEIAAGKLRAPKGSRVSLRLYGEVGALSVDETVSGRAGLETGPATATSQSFDIVQPGRLEIKGQGGREWKVELAPDIPPQVMLQGKTERDLSGRMRQRFHAQDDFGVTSGRAKIALNLAATPRRYGLITEPDPREAVEVDLPMTIGGNRKDFVGTLVEDFSRHPWANLPVSLTLTVTDAAGQEGQSEAMQISLPGRSFFDPFAAALIEQRRDLLWARANGRRVAQVIRALIHRPDDSVVSARSYLPLRMAIKRLEAGLEAPSGLSAETQDEVAEALWAIAVQIEDGDLADAAERLRQAQERLEQAMRDGATDEEIARLMDALRQAMQDYMRQMAQQQGSKPSQQFSGEMQTITADQLQQLLDRLQQLMEEGRMAEAQQLLDMLAQMMANMQAVQGQAGGMGQGGMSPGDQAMQGLADMLRDQQGLSDESFSELQQWFNPGGSQGQSGTGSLADRQGGLQQRLDDFRRNLPGAGTEEGDAAREALRQGSDAMGDAEEALGNDDLAGALDSQAQALEALREGMRNLGEALARAQGQSGQPTGQTAGERQRDPLGRESGASGQIGTDENLLQDTDVYRRAQDLLDEIRRRSGERERPQQELDYLRRLLERF